MSKQIFPHIAMNKTAIGSKQYLKDAIAVGTYKHPKDGWTLEVTPEKIDKWVDTFIRMSAKGIKVPLVKDHVVKTDTVLGYVTGAYRDGDTLMFTSAIADDDSEATVKRVNNVSIFVEDMTDGKGETFKDAITHIALTPEPVVSGQGGFVSLAASNGGASEEIPVFSLAIGVSNMKKDLLEKFRALVKLAADKSEDDVLQGISQHLEERGSVLQKLEADLKAANEKLAELSKPQKPEDAATLEERAEDVSDSIEEMVKSGQITPALSASLRSELCGSTEARNTFMLSRSANPNASGIRPIRAKALLNIIKDIKPVALGGQTSAMSFSRDTGDKPEGAALADRLIKQAAETSFIG